MSNRRLARLNERIKREISDIIRTQVRDPRIGLPTVTDVDVTPDLWMARVFVRPDPTHDEEEHDALIQGLTTAAPYIRRELGKTLNVRRVPELRFQADRTLEHALRIERILRDVLPDEEADDDPEEAEEAPSGEEGAAGGGDAHGEPSDPDDDPNPGGGMPR